MLSPSVTVEQLLRLRRRQGTETILDTTYEGAYPDGWRKIKLTHRFHLTSSISPHRARKSVLRRGRGKKRGFSPPKPPPESRDSQCRRLEPESMWVYHQRLQRPFQKIGPDWTVSHHYTMRTHLKLHALDKSGRPATKGESENGTGSGRHMLENISTDQATWLKVPFSNFIHALETSFQCMIPGGPASNSRRWNPKTVSWECHLPMESSSNVRSCTPRAFSCLRPPSTGSEDDFFSRGKGGVFSIQKIDTYWSRTSLCVFWAQHDAWLERHERIRNETERI